MRESKSCLSALHLPILAARLPSASKTFRLYFNVQTKDKKITLSMTLKAHFSSTIRINLAHQRSHAKKQTNKKHPYSSVQTSYRHSLLNKSSCLFLKKQVTNAEGKCRQDCKYLLLLKQPCKSASTKKPNLNCESPCDLVVIKDFNRGHKSIMSNRCPL